MNSKLAETNSLTLVKDFVNTADLENAKDELGTLESATTWLAAHGAGVCDLSEADRQHLVAVREALRELLEGNAGHEVNPKSLEFLNQSLNDAHLGMVITGQGCDLACCGSGLNGFLGMISKAIFEATVAGNWQRLKVCRNETCRWAFYDSSKNGTGTWCTMKVCGSRAKSRAYRARRRVAA